MLEQRGRLCRVSRSASLPSSLARIPAPRPEPTGPTEDVSECFVEPNYRGRRIEVNAVRVDGAWDAEVRIRRTLSEEKSHVERVTCRKPTAKVAEERGVIYARRWVDRHGDSRITRGRP